MPDRVEVKRTGLQMGNPHRAESLELQLQFLDHFLQGNANAFPEPAHRDLPRTPFARGVPDPHCHRVAAAEIVSSMSLRVWISADDGDRRDAAAKGWPRVFRRELDSARSRPNRLFGAHARTVPVQRGISTHLDFEIWPSYLGWGSVDDAGRFTVFRRAKLMLADLPPDPRSDRREGASVVRG